MSDQSLRAALDKLASDLSKPIPESYSYPEANAYVDGKKDANESTADVIRDLLAAHPAEPGPVVTDEAVQDLHAGVVTQFRRHGQYTLADARAALEAAAPLLGPRPLLDREAVHQAIAENVWVSGDDGDTNVEIIEAVPAVMELARPMPTREQIAEATHTETEVHEWLGGQCSGSCQDHHLSHASAVMALLNGAES